MVTRRSLVVQGILYFVNVLWTLGKRSTDHCEQSCVNLEYATRSQEGGE